MNVQKFLRGFSFSSLAEVDVEEASRIANGDGMERVFFDSRQCCRADRDSLEVTQAKECNSWLIVAGVPDWLRRSVCGPQGLPALDSFVVTPMTAEAEGKFEELDVRRRSRHSSDPTCHVVTVEDKDPSKLWMQVGVHLMYRWLYI